MNQTEEYLGGCRMIEDTWKSDYEQICKNLRIAAYLDEEDEVRDDRMWDTGDLLVKMSELIGDAKEVIE